MVTKTKKFSSVSISRKLRKLFWLQLVLKRLLCDLDMQSKWKGKLAILSQWSGEKIMIYQPCRREISTTEMLKL